jgi:Zn finger protein HypA/HybF involved in hydrogenase expression
MGVSAKRSRIDVDSGELQIRCAKCKQYKPTEAFYRRTDWDGWQSYCRPCQSATSAANVRYWRDRWRLLSTRQSMQGSDR